ncbi:hypothetical protein C2845_PM01G00540 [Panicum miliaceum]|uniref:beta-carotene 3-hydroxylase n=1 Tax=Panicum miliaceum TaxID=4540 RepID=A0A3L6TQV7_PANMI|nr:hypothetical protein C2845_PM01G00540 [Panicum miliaceum]
MAVARLVAAPTPVAASRLLGPRPAVSGSRAAPRLVVFAPLPVPAVPRRTRVAADDEAVVGGEAADGGEGEAARRAVSERAARKQSERRTYLVAAVMSSLGITSMAAAAVYYRFAWQMEGGEIPVTEMVGTFALSVGAAVSDDSAFGGPRGMFLHREMRDRLAAGRDGVLGAVGAPGAVARVAVAHARVPPPPPRRALRAQRRLRHRQRRPGHVAPGLRLLQPRPRPRPLLRRGPGDHAVRDGVHVRARRPRPPPLPRGAHRERALLPACRRRPSDTPHGQVPGRALRPVPRPQGAEGGGRDRGAGEGDQEEDQEERDLRCHPIRAVCLLYTCSALRCFFFASSAFTLDLFTSSSALM